jgi:hypothetical protein
VPKWRGFYWKHGPRSTVLLTMSNSLDSFPSLAEEVAGVLVYILSAVVVAHDDLRVAVLRHHLRLSVAGPGLQRPRDGSPPKVVWSRLPRDAALPASAKRKTAAESRSAAASVNVAAT